MEFKTRGSFLKSRQVVMKMRNKWVASWKMWGPAFLEPNIFKGTKFCFSFYQSVLNLSLVSQLHRNPWSAHLSKLSLLWLDVNIFCIPLWIKLEVFRKWDQLIVSLAKAQSLPVQGNSSFFRVSLFDTFVLVSVPVTFTRWNGLDSL